MVAVIYSYVNMVVRPWDRQTICVFSYYVPVMKGVKRPLAKHEAGSFGVMLSELQVFTVVKSENPS
ncbi:MAG TPA: hypothetical protein VG206_26770, partial [Terriglobia bacterium]|nr:hypothetical protein [Terriglobia bacterium]